MSTEKFSSLDIDPALKARLSTLAEREGASVDQFVAQILGAHADELERILGEAAEDEQRWRRYLETGASVPLETVQDKLRRLAARAAEKAVAQ